MIITPHECSNFFAPLQYGSSDATLLLLGNKDHEQSKRVVSWEEGRHFADQVGIPFLECSAKTAHNIEQVRDYLVMSL